MLQEIYLSLAGKYSGDAEKAGKCWEEIGHAYAKKGRAYHTLDHLENLVRELMVVRERIADWETMIFSICYHDVVYSAMKGNNEEKSAELAEERLTGLSVPSEMVTRCKEQILATKGHHVSEDGDINYFTDADLSVLGKDWDSYAVYASNVRKEYSIYPDMVYKPGRIKVLQSFLDMDRIYKTDFFFERYEDAAKRNLQREIDLLRTGGGMVSSMGQAIV